MAKKSLTREHHSQHIREAKIKDLGYLIETLGRDVLHHSGMPSLETQLSIIEAKHLLKHFLQKGQNVILVAEQGGDLVGCMIFLSKHIRANECFGDLFLHLQEEYRGCNIASKFIFCLETRLKKKNMRLRITSRRNSRRHSEKEKKRRAYLNTFFPQFKFVTYRERPDLIADFRAVLNSSGYAYMAEEPISKKYWDDLYETFSEYQFALIRATDDRVIGVGYSLPIFFDEGLNIWPREGWDWALEMGFKNQKKGFRPNTQCGLLLKIRPEYRGLGYSKIMIQALKRIGKQKGFSRLIVPVRPVLKYKYPLNSMQEYIEWKNQDGRIFDPWIRTHIELGGILKGICSHSMQIKGTVEEWECWTDMQFPTSGKYVLPGALALLDIDHATDKGVYTEPNVWVQHEIL